VFARLDSCRTQRVEYRSAAGSDERLGCGASQPRNAGPYRRGWTHRPFDGWARVSSPSSSCVGQDRRSKPALSVTNLASGPLPHPAHGVPACGRHDERLGCGALRPGNAGLGRRGWTHRPFDGWASGRSPSSSRVGRGPTLPVTHGGIIRATDSVPHEAHGVPARGRHERRDGRPPSPSPPLIAPASPAPPARVAERDRSPRAAAPTTSSPPPPPTGRWPLPSKANVASPAAG
jgi:hypothetical protein